MPSRSTLIRGGGLCLAVAAREALRRRSKWSHRSHGGREGRSDAALVRDHLLLT